MTISLPELLSIEDDESIVYSICAVPSDHETAWELVHGSLLIVPSACAEASWPAWGAVSGRSLAADRAVGLAASQLAQSDDWLMGRAVMAVSRAADWLQPLRGVIGSEPTPVELPAAHPLPPVSATLSEPAALMRIFPGVDAPASSLLAGLGRPVDGLLWRGPAGRCFPEPQQVTVGETTSYLPARDLAGIHITPEAVDPAKSTVRGLLIGRAERGAWLVGMRGSGDFDHFIVQLGWDPDRVDLADLEINHIERINREQVLQIRTKLEDLDTTEVDDRGLCGITLPTIGRSADHEVFLHNREGDLLDRTGPYPLVERLGVTMVVDGQTLPQAIHGITEPPPALDERLDRRDEIAEGIEDLVRNATQARLIADRQTGLERLRWLLGRAKGELLVIDPYFGQDPADWQLLDDVPVSVRVLTAKVANSPTGDVAPAPMADHVKARYRARAPIHDRVYLWEGGGLSVGGSLTTFGRGPIGLNRLRAADVEFQREYFETLWASELFSDLPRAEPES